VVFKKIILTSLAIRIEYPSVPGVDVYKNKEGVGTVEYIYY
jgi:hypothetical protein